MIKETVPRKSIYRLSLYLRSLQKLRANQIDTVSSETLAKAAGVKSTQLRKDLAYFGQFGTRGLGYSVEALYDKLNAVLGTARLQPVILVGAGNLGSALLRYDGFTREGFEFLAAFDAEPDRRRPSDLPVNILPMENLTEFVREHGVKMAILAVPGTTAQEVTNRLVETGIQGILNFTPIILQVPEEVVVNNVDLALELENLSYFVR